MELSEIEMDLSEFLMHFSELENPTKSIQTSIFRHLNLSKFFLKRPI